MADAGAEAPHPPHGAIGGVVLRQRFGWRWLAAFAAAVAGSLLFVYATVVLVVRGVGVWGTNIPHVWGFDIINYAWWIGIANAASLMAAAFTVRRAPWRSALNRFAESVALFSVICAGLFPILHLGRPWLFHWVFPYPATFGVWPQFRSPLVWDFFTILTHLVVTASFWYVGLIPDLAHLRDRARGALARKVFGVLALGWRGSARHWRNHQRAYHTLAGLLVAMAVFMQSTVSTEFAVTLVPEWHQPRYPLYFVVSGLISGIGMVLVVALLARHFFELHGFITQRHLDVVSSLLIANAIVIAWSYAFEAFSSWYASKVELQSWLLRATGEFAWLYWGAVACAVLAPQVLWWRRMRRNVAALILVGLLVAVGIWLDRFMIVVGGLLGDYLPSAWEGYSPSVWEWPLLVGSIAVYGTLILLFLRFVPVIPVFEVHAGRRDEDGDEARDEDGDRSGEDDR
ncbi:NrfD/PsrC family molybdoenzyme membrane anchor subunit [Arenibaculum sp.]|uniref:NrfD/PsrC family molybdoenzyme membrane anchor subunit n=1 Tax=Arenibaculum sp. TaxID=2865862 RepID=UPI002E0ED82B|nr:NrfD/PsrC family molybdoenzyme membrane anchor subunit [Arenibaculum sp.]